MEPGTTRLDKLSDEIRRIWWAFGPADNRGAKVLELTERAKRMENEHAELLAALKEACDVVYDTSAWRRLIARIEDGR